MYPAQGGHNAGMMPGYAAALPPGQTRSLQHVNSFVVQPGLSQFPGQPSADPNRYTVRDDSGYVLLAVTDTNGGINPAMRCLLVCDPTNVEVIRISYGMNTQVATVLGAGGQLVGSVMLSAKAKKDHKPDKEAKRQVVLQNGTGSVLLSMSGKMKHGSSVEMKIKSEHVLASTLPLAHQDKKHKDKKDKDKKDKDKKKSKKSEVGEVSGSLATGFRVSITNYNASLQERVNIVALITAYMELEKNGAGGMMATQAPGMYAAQVDGGRQQPPPFNPTMAMTPGHQPFTPAMGVGQPPFNPPLGYGQAPPMSGYGQLAQPAHGQLPPAHGMPPNPAYIPQPGVHAPGFAVGGNQNPSAGFNMGGAPNAGAGFVPPNQHH